MFEAPIPGQSLTTEPGARPWEQPPQIDDPDGAMEYYLPKIYGTMDKMMDLLEKGVPVSDVVHPLLMAGVMKGVHTIDTALIIAAPLTDYVAGLADKAGIEYTIGDEDKLQADPELADEAFNTPSDTPVDVVDAAPIDEPAGVQPLMSRRAAPSEEGMI
jgi:hypothetical protein